MKLINIPLRNLRTSSEVDDDIEKAALSEISVTAGGQSFMGTKPKYETSSAWPMSAFRSAPQGSSLVLLRSFAEDGIVSMICERNQSFRLKNYFNARKRRHYDTKSLSLFFQDLEFNGVMRFYYQVRSLDLTSH